ncbi:MAG: hypothetical protein JW776_02000 [Candidatus Lokiarchaeota archaeon]|nr:hypothetical protein [Candidatus Lokiarchaeota archaeon]
MIRLKFSKSKIVIGSSFEYEDILTIILLKELPDSFDAEFAVSGKIISGSDFTPTMKNLGLDLGATQKKDKETNKVQNYVCNINSKSPVWVTKDTMIQLMNKLHTNCYLLLDFKIYLCSECASNMVLDRTKKLYRCASCGIEQKKPKVEYSITTKSSPPRPTTKQKGVPKSEKQKLASKIKFCQATMPNTDSAKKLLLNEITSDFLDEIPSNFKQIELVNNYHINNLVFPPKELRKNSKLFRKMTIREGSLERILDVDGNCFETVIQFKI